ncbi:transglycosylase family protein [Kitasatospora setae]|uniref:transglycosylase family protein n=1 Tax=Kitasatospora setae TaxID=2066 RepID=UPI000ACDE773
MIFRNETAATKTATTADQGNRKRNRVRGAIVAGTAVAVLPVAGLVTATSASAADVSTWDKVAQCESTGNWSINSGNGFYGGLQFTSSTWAAFGGTAYAPQANQATKALHQHRQLRLRLRRPGPPVLEEEHHHQRRWRQLHRQVR